MSSHIKKIAIPLTIVGIALWRPAPAAAAFSSVNKFTNSATVTFTGAGSATMSAPILHKVSDNSVVPSPAPVTWTGVALPVTWARSDQYIEVNSAITASNGGIQIYTDNTNAAATPKFTGNPAVVDPSGLVDTTNTALRLPIAWTVKTTVGPVTGTPTVPAVPPVATEPNNASAVPFTDINAPQWIYMLDKGTLASVGGGAVNFANGSPPVEVMDGSLGIHAASGGGPQGNGFFTGTFPKVFIYSQANFGAASTPRSYATDQLILESFTQ